ncbi:MAG: WGR domain-containing protein [Deltaproteobacteria bacterium]|nr:WGR domain-containing protein [Deltaproteobacteria bacterium]
MIRLEFTDEKSSKFWEIEVSGLTHTVRFGRVGTTGQEKSKTFASSGEAQANADKLVAEKRRKGYVESSTRGGTQSGASADGEGPAGKLRALLSGLCSTQSDQKILNALCKKVKSVSGKGPYKVEFEEGEMEVSPPREVVYREELPRSFSEIAGVIGSVLWDAGGPEMGFGLSKSGQPEADDEGIEFLRDEDPDTVEELDKAGGASAAFACGQNWLVFDPTRKLKNGEKALAFISHESVEWEPVKSADSLDYKQILLRLIADQMIGTSHLEEIYA